jgi:hypothetical protein
VTFKYPSLAQPGVDLKQHTELLKAIKEALEIAQRLRGDPGKSFVRLEELSALGLTDAFLNPIPPSITGIGTGEANTASNIGAGQGLYVGKTGVDLRFKTLVAGTNVTLTPATDTVTISATGGGGGGYSYFPSGWG